MISRHFSARIVLLYALVAGLLSVPIGVQADEQQPAKGKAPDKERVRVIDTEESESIMRGPVPIRASRVDPLPAAGSGRLSIAFEGNRRWCTFPDDRLQESPIKTPHGPQRRRDVFTFGYQFTVAAVERARPDTTLLLYSSPVITTATLRQAGKLGRGTTPGRAGSLNSVAVPDEGMSKERINRETAATLVPYWDEAQRCAMLGEQFDFDLDPGRYDVYISFDIQMRSGAWVHRTYAYLTDIEVAQGSRTLVDGLLEMRGGGRRDLQLRSASLEPLPEKGAARR